MSGKTKKIIRKISKSIKRPHKVKVVKIVKKIKIVKKTKRTVRIVKKQAKKTAPAHKKETKPKNFAFLDAPIFKTKIKVIGIGGGGGSIVSEIGRSLEKASFVIADTDIRAIKKKSGIKYFYFGEDVTHGLGTGMNPELAREAAEKERERITAIMEGQDIVILISSLGGGLGSGAAPVFAEISRNLGNVTLGIFTLPFKFEGAKKASVGQKAVQQLKKHLNAIITIPNEKIFKVISEKTSITEAFSMVNKNLIESLESLIDLIYNPGLINIDFADVRAILKGTGMSAFLNTTEAAGKDRALQVVENILKNPLINSNVEAEKILYNIAASDNLSMLEVDQISRSIAELNPQAKIIFGISKNQKFKNKIKTTILLTGPSIDVPERKEVIIKKEIIAVDPKKDEKIAEKVIIKKESVLARAVSEKKEHHKIEKKSEPEKKPIVRAKKETKIRVEKKKEKIEKREKIIPKIVKEKKIELAKPAPTKEEKKEIRKSAMDLKKEQDIEESKRLTQEEEWEIPAFLRRVKFKA